MQRPEILRAFARHHRTGEPMPDELIARLTTSRRKIDIFGPLVNGVRQSKARRTERRPEAAWAAVGLSSDGSIAIPLVATGCFENVFLAKVISEEENLATGSVPSVSLVGSNVHRTALACGSLASASSANRTQTVVS